MNLREQFCKFYKCIHTCNPHFSQGLECFHQPRNSPCPPSQTISRKEDSMLNIVTILFAIRSKARYLLIFYATMPDFWIPEVD